jgi:hypothetical protein
MDLNFQHFDLSLEKRRETKIRLSTMRPAMLSSGLGLKAATITPTEPVTSAAKTPPEEEIDGEVILRIGRVSAVRRWVACTPNSGRANGGG